MKITYQAAHPSNSKTSAHENALSKARKACEAGLWQEAKHCYQQVLSVEPKRASTWINLAAVLDKLGDLYAALECAEKGIALGQPSNDFYYNRAVILEHLKRYRDSARDYLRALALNESDAYSWHGLGLCLRKIKDREALLQEFRQNFHTLDSKMCFLKSIQLKPNFINAYISLANLYILTTRYTEALQYAQQAAVLNPLNLTAALLMLQSKQFLGNWHDRDVLVMYLLNQLRQALQKKEVSLQTIKPFVFYQILLPLTLDERRRISSHYAMAIENQMGMLKKHYVFSKSVKNKLRLGYLSVDYRSHATAYLIQELFKYHNRDKFDVYAYSYGENDNSDYRLQLSQAADKFVELNHLTLEESAEKIYSDDIDILIDLTGFTAQHRFGILALKPAPIQVNYLGYGLSTGSSCIDYMLVDDAVVKQNEIPFYSEKLIFLPNSYYMLNSAAMLSSLKNNRRDYGLNDDTMVYCCFNQTYKIEPIIFSAWMTILKAVPNSVLWLMGDDHCVCEQLCAYAQTEGVTTDRLIFAPSLPWREHLQRVAQADLFLDTLQVNALTTACDAVLAGVPVLTVAGDYILNRGCASIMTAAGLPECVMSDIAQYQETAIALGNNRSQLMALKNKLRHQQKTAPLFDSAAKVRALERAYAQMWLEYSDNT